jgi:hypothetical protein
MPFGSRKKLEKRKPLPLLLLSSRTALPDDAARVLEEANGSYRRPRPEDRRPLLPPPCLIRRLGENVCKLSGDFNELDDDLAFIDAAPQEVELEVDVLAPIVEHWIVWQCNGRLIVNHQCWRSSFFLSDDLQLPVQLECLTRTHGH